MIYINIKMLNIKVNIKVLGTNKISRNTCHLSDWRINQSKRINISQVYVTTVITTEHVLTLSKT